MRLNIITTIIEHLNFNERLPTMLLNNKIIVFCSTNLNGDYTSIYNNKTGIIAKDRKNLYINILKPNYH